MDAYLSAEKDVLDTRNDYVFMGRAPDCIRFVGGKLHTIEAKLKNWKQAIKQAKDHQLLADFAWILIPNPKLKWIEESEENGIGLIDGYSFKRVSYPAQSTVVWDPGRQKILDRYYKEAAL